MRICYYVTTLYKYKYHFYYDNLDWLAFGIENKLKWKNFRLHLWLAKKSGVKIAIFPSGCRGELTKEEFSKFDKGNVCNNCGFKFCDDRINKARLRLVNKYADLVVGWATFNSPHFNYTHCKYKSLDLKLWKPNLKIPKKFILPATNNLRILHSFYNEDRLNGGKNIKGSPAIVAAINKLKEEGYKVEYMHITDKASNEMRYYQSQSDIVVEQLIYGWWGSTGVETMCLGKPVVCYLRPSWKSFFLKQFPEHKALPIIEATTLNVYQELKRLVVDKRYRQLKGRQSRNFATRHYDSKLNTNKIIEILEAL